jgi:hypothetical protein
MQRPAEYPPTSTASFGTSSMRRLVVRCMSCPSTVPTSNGSSRSHSTGEHQWLYDSVRTTTVEMDIPKDELLMSHFSVQSFICSGVKRGGSSPSMMSL